MTQIEFLIFLMFVTNMCVLGCLSYATLRNKDVYKKELDELRNEVERLKNNLLLWEQRSFNRNKNTDHNRKWKGEFYMNKILRNLLFDGVDGYIEELKVELATTKDSSRKQDIIKELYNLEELKNKQKVHKIKGADILKASVGVLTVIAVLKHEETNIITSKIWGFATGLLK